ncbi:hypothetical protein [Amycolatopsis plumensis]|uniref:Uncharacterized protein n=1 Tax=Amycolatopsis plumensis TaxID=236508 RepID=A0ABV5UC45_9PSEU
MLEEQDEVGARARKRFQAAPHAEVAVPERHVGLDVGVRAGQARQDSPVVQEREVLALAAADPRRRHEVRCQLTPRAAARGTDPVVRPRRQAVKVGRRVGVRQFDIGERNPFDEDGLAGDPQQPGRATDAGAERAGRGQEVVAGFREDGGDLLVTSQPGRHARTSGR